MLRALAMLVLALVEELLSIEPCGLMMRRGDADFRLAVNRALARIYRTDSASSGGPAPCRWPCTS